MNPQMLTQFKQFMQNPSALLSQMGIPQNMQNNPHAIIQHLMDTGRLSQAQYMQLQQQAEQMKSFFR